MRKLFVLSGAIVFLAVFSVAVQAQPQPSMYTLDNIYYYLAEGTEASWGAHSLEPLSGVPGEDIPGFTKSLSDIYYYMVDIFGGCDAAPDQVVNTVTFFSADTDNWGQKSGAIPTKTVSNSTVSQLAGYYNAFNLSTVDSNLTAAKIKDNTVIFGVTGTFPNDGNATDGQVLSGKTYYSNTSTKHTGSISSKTAQTYTPKTSNQTIASGQYLSGTQTISGDSNLVSANICRDVNIFGVSGDSNVANTSTGTAATAADILLGKIAWVNGEEVTGTLLNETTCNALTGWTWLNGACWSDAIADSVSWNKGVGNDTSTTGNYEPNTSGTLKSRMEAVVAGRWSEICTSINSVTITTGMNGATGKSNISAMAIADCVDGARDIGPSISGSYWESRSNTLKTWATASGHSALPATDYNGGNNEYEAACSGDFYLNTSTLSPGTNYCWGAACGSSSGDNWDTNARVLGYNSCSNQNISYTSDSADAISFRVVVRPAAE